MADSVASPQSRPQRAASKKRRQGSVSIETENKLARAARSAQRLAQLSDLSRDDSTLDLFPDDPTRATLQAMNIDVRQGTLHGFELPDVVLAAVGAMDAGDPASMDSRSVRRAPRPAKPDEQPAPVNGQLSGLEIEPLPSAVSSALEPHSPDAKPVDAANVAAGEKPSASGPFCPAMAAATVARSVTALRHGAEPGATADAANEPSSTSARAPQCLPGTVGKAASPVASQEAAAEIAGESDEPEPDAAFAESGTGAEASANASAAPQISGEFAASSRDARRAEAAAAALRATPELDRARATAFADTVEALYGVIADQRHAATNHSRRMKWMLSVVVGALLVTVAIGITQTVLLMRLTRETTAQQLRIEHMMQNQQTAMTSLLDTHIAIAHAEVAAAASDAAAAAAATPQEPAAATRGRRVARVQHARKPKVVASR